MRGIDMRHKYLTSSVIKGVKDGEKNEDGNKGTLE